MPVRGIFFGNIVAAAGAVDRSAVDSLTISDAAARLGLFVRAPSDSLTITDAAVRALVTSRTTADSLTITDAVVRALAAVRAAADSLTITDGAARVGSFGRTAAVTLTITDAATWIKTTSRAGADSLAITDAVARAAALARAIADSLTISDAAAWTKTTSRAAADSLTISDAAVRGVGIGRGTADSLTISDAALRAIATSRASADSLTITDAAVAVRYVPGPSPKGLTGAVEYCVELFDSGGTFGPNNKTGEIWDFRNLGWSRYDRLPGKGFGTLYQDSPHLNKFAPLITHVRVTRVTPSGDTEVYNGVFIDYDSTGDDVVVDFFDYNALFAISRSGYRTLYPRKMLGTEIVQPEVDAAIAKTFSPLGFITRGTIENPLGTDGSTPITTNQEFGLLDQSRLQLLYDLSEMGRANTVNHVSFAVSRTSPFTFTFTKSAGSARDIGLTLNGSVSDYHYLPNWSRYRNDLATLGTTVGGGSTEITATDEAAAAARGRRQDVATIKTLLGITSSAIEADQQQAATQRILKTATQRTGALALRLERGTLAPFAGWDICDTLPLEIVNGMDSLTTRWRVAGVRALFTEGGEDLSLVVEPVLV